MAKLSSVGMNNSLESLQSLARRNLAAGVPVPWTFEQPIRYEPFDFEKVINYQELVETIHRNWTFPFYFSIGYLIVIFGIQKYMKDKKPLGLRTPLVLWNLALGYFSIFGFFRIAPELYDVLSSDDGFHKSICVRTMLNPPSAAWGGLFAISKYFELGDTIFIVLRKQPLIFLQWYHHCVSMILAWQVVPYAEPIHRYYAVMNYGVHGIMYPYFALKALKFKIPRSISLMITSVQLLQMIIGVFVNFYSWYLIGTGVDCYRDPYTIKWIGGIYFSFMILFAHFLYKTYFSKEKKA